MRRSSVTWLVVGLALLTGAGAAALAASRHGSRAALTPGPAASTPTPPASPPPLLRRQGDLLIAQRTKGSASAPLTVYELSDFQCPYCRRQAVETFPTIEDEFIKTGKVRWIFLNFPLTQLHPNAAAAAEFAMCAAKNDHFWPVHDLLFHYQDKWAPLKDPAPFLMTLADSAGIPRDDMTSCLQGGEMRTLIQAEAEGAAKSGVRSTPTVYIEGVGLLAGAAPVEIFRQVLDSLWKEKTAKK